MLVSVLAASFLAASVVLAASDPTIEWWVIGAGGGILGGLAGLSGALPTIWASLRGWGRDTKRGVFQSFNLSILLLALVSQAIGGFIGAEVGKFLLIALPGTLLGAWLGRKTYNRLGDNRFNQVVLVLLLLSGISMIVTSSSGA